MRQVLLSVGSAAVLAAGVGLCSLPNHVHADQTDVVSAKRLEQQTQNQVRFLSGGVGDQEQARLRELSSEYNLRVALTRKSGAYVSRVDITIADEEGSSLVTTTTRGPIFLAQLAPGTYVLRATSEGRSEERRVIDVPKDADQIRMYVALEDSPS